MKDKQLKPVKDDGRKNKIYCDEAAAAQTLEVPRMHVGSLQRTFLHLFERSTTIGTLECYKWEVDFYFSHVGELLNSTSYRCIARYITILSIYEGFFLIIWPVYFLKLWPKSSKLLQLIDRRVTLSTSSYPLWFPPSATYPVFESFSLPASNFVCTTFGPRMVLGNLMIFDSLEK